jgi:hypothetical protein
MRNISLDSVMYAHKQRMRIKMTATINSMELVYADLLTPSQLMEGDLVEIDEIIVDVISIEDDATGDNYTITYKNDYGEEDVFLCDYEHVFKLYVFIEQEEE